jgi:hypothetical protein
MTITTVFKLEITEEELRIIRSALCDKALKELGKAHNVQKEAEEAGVEDTASHIYMQVRNQIRSIINKIDEKQ